MISLVANIWEKTRKLNYEFKNDIWQLQHFEWPEWEKLSIELKTEHIEWFKRMLKTDLAPFTPEERHEFAVLNRIKHGWQIGQVRDNAEKVDPYLKPLSECGDWFSYWCLARDYLYIKEIKKNWITCRNLKKN